MENKKSHPTYESQIFLGTVVLDPALEKKRIVIDHPSLYLHFLQSVCKPGDKVAMSITNRRPKRTDSQNRYMHLYFTLIGQSSGSPMMVIKNWAKGRFLSKGITEVYGDKVRIVTETSKLNISECCEFLNRIVEDTEVPLPDPEPFNLPLTLDEYGRLKESQRKEYSKYKAKIKHDKPKINKKKSKR